MIMNKHRKRILIILSIIIVAIAAVFVKNYNDSKLPAPIVVPTDIDVACFIVLSSNKSINKYSL